MYFLRNLGLMLVNFLRSLIRMPSNLYVSLPVGAAAIVALFLVICVAVVVMVNLDADRSFLGLWWGRLPIVFGVIALITVVTYYGVKLWMEPGVSAFEDIDLAWRLGVEELEKKGIILTETPLFFLFGSAGERFERGLISASRLELAVDGAPRGGEHPLHWYANRDGIYLVLTKVGCVSDLHREQARIDDEHSAARFRGGESAPAEQPSLLRPAAGDIRTTAMPDQGTVPGGGLLQNPLSERSPFAARSAGGGDIKGTMTFDAGGGGHAGQTLIFQTPGESTAPKPKAVLDRAQSDIASQRLEHLCRLARRARATLCPMNGAMLLLPYNMLVADRETAGELRKAAVADMTTAVRALKLRFPTTTLVTNLETERGFHELVLRLGPEKTKNQRFGKGFDVWARTTREQVESINAQACGAFESFIYHLFREKGALDKPQNRKLYALLCKVRYYVQNRLGSILVETYAEDPETERRVEAPLFSGCYFAATGETPGEQAFVKNVFDRLPDQQEDVDWTPAALREDRTYGLFANIGWLFSLVLLGILAFMAYRKFRS
jgi:hypothetical protein